MTLNATATGLKPMTPVQFAAIVASLAVVGLLMGVMSGERSPADESRLPCNRFRSASLDYSRGVLTVPELRSEMRQVDGYAFNATPAVRTAAGTLLAALTGDLPSAPAAVEALDIACSSAGH